MRLRLAVLPLLLAACAPPRVPAPPAGGASVAPLTRAERSGFTETSRHADVLAFLDSLRAADGAPLHFTTLGRSGEGREIPLVIASRPRVATPEEARALGRPVVYLQGNIHGGEVEGKEALQMLLRDLAREPGPNVLDSLVLLVVPIYNPDGNERFGPQAQNRSEQNGPALVGERPNAQGLDLNRDYVKAEAPETRAALELFGRWSPELLVDLHTTNGSYHGYALTYSPSLNPAAGASAAFAREELLPALRRRVRERRGYETFDYGNFSLRYGADVNTDTLREGWFTYDHRPRFGTNYYGLRGGVSLLGEAYSHDPFERRVRATYAWLRELLSLAAERGEELTRLTRAGYPPAAPVPVRAELTRSPYLGEVIAEELAHADSGVVTEPGVPAGLRRTGRFRTLRIPVHDRFDPLLHRPAPAAYLLGPEQEEAVALLRRHGLRVRRLEADTTVRAELFVVDSVARAPRPFQGHREVTLAGAWREAERRAPAGAYWVPADQPLGVLAVYLLEPQSDDGLTTWNVFDPWLVPGREHPVARVSAATR